MKIPKIPFVPQVGTDKVSLKQSLKTIIDRNVTNSDPFFLIDIGDVYRKHLKWQRMLPRVEPFFAVKCCPEPKIVESLVSLGLSFDCASKAEIEQVLKLGVSPSQVIYAHPAKPISHLQYAREVGVELMTFDNEYELSKIKEHYPTAKLVLRILADDPNAVCNLGVKFGAHADSTLNLLNIAQTLNLNVVGVSFHVGSGCQNPQAFETAVAQARRVFDEGRSVGYDFSLLDIGGGFPGSESALVNFRDIANVLNVALDKYFPDPSVRVIAEPGRYYVASACTLVLNVVAKKAARTEVPSFMYYVNDGLYGALNCCVYDHAVVTLKAMKEDQYLENLTHCSVWGPTCDGFDCITRDCVLPELQIGDWIYLEDAGAYTLAAGCNFNGFERPHHFYTFSATEKFDDSLLPESFPLRPHLPCTLANYA